MGKFLGSIFVIALFISYLANIVKLFSETVAGMAVARGIGIFVLPLGIVLGLC